MSYIDAPLPPHIVAELEAANLPPGVVVKKNRFGRWVAIKEAVYEKLESLGPFATKSAKLNIKFEENSGRYSIDFSKHEKLSVFESLDVIPSGSHGPFSKVTLPESAKAAANIPSEATHFCFCYPPTGVATLSNQQKQNLEEPVSRGDPEFTFLTFGGFAYFDCGVEHTKFLCANALVQGETGLTFEGPFRWKSEYTQFLYRQSRFEPVTISSLSEKGLQLYCFINPKETLKSLLPNKPWAPCSDGGFVYLYNADGTPHPYDCYFSVTPQVRNSSLSTSGSSFSFPLSSSPLSSSPSSLSSSPSSPCSLSSSFSGLQMSPQTQELLQKEKHKEAQQPEKKEKEKEREETEQKEKPFSVVEKVKKPTTGTIEEFLCSICLHRPVRIMLLPCRHLCVCNECVLELKQKSEIVYCPLCRDRVVDSWTVFVTET